MNFGKLQVVPDKARWNLVKSEAERFSRVFSTPPIPVREIAESNGVSVRFVEFSPEYSEKVAGVCDFEKAQILVNSEDTTQRQIFTMAHEFGHWMLHRDIFLNNPERYPVLMRYQQPSNTDPLEQEANCFAANLLVPEKLLKTVINAPISVLASIFQVSKIMMEHRVKDVRRR